jgi:hypothetical protein
MAIGHFSNPAIMTGKASAAITEDRIVKISTTAADAFLFTQAVAAETPFGIAVETRAADALDLPVAINGLGRLSVDAGTPILVGDFLKPDANGRGVKSSSGDASIAQAMEPAASGTPTIKVLITNRKA